jgi:hypothetical protein
LASQAFTRSFYVLSDQALEQLTRRLRRRM